MTCTSNESIDTSSENGVPKNESTLMKEVRSNTSNPGQESKYKKENTFEGVKSFVNCP